MPTSQQFWRRIAGLGSRSVKVAGRWVYQYQAIDQFGQVIDVLVSPKRDALCQQQDRIRPRPNEVQTAGSNSSAARVISTGHALIQNLRRGPYELGVGEPTTLQVAAAFAELAAAI